MQKVPSIWRTEVWHPLSVHFPIAVLLLASIAGILYLFPKNKQIKKLLLYNRVIFLCIGTVTAWIAIYTGSLAYNVVVRNICDPGVLQDHQWWAYAATITYSVAAFLDILNIAGLIKQKQILAWGITIMLLYGAFALAYAGHLGARVVYQQGAGVYQPSEDCNEFE